MCKNILFIGPYRQYDGWGLAARDYIEALRLTKHNIAIRPIYMSKPNDIELSSALIELENKQFTTQPDIVIQNVLPEYMDYQSGSKNIGLCYVETSKLQHTGWIERINLMDELWVASTHEKLTLNADGVTVPINIIPMPINTAKLDQCKKQWPIANAETTCIFYTIAEYSERKNLVALLTAYYLEFHATENVQLLIKTHKPGLSEAKLYKYIAQDQQTLKKRLRLHNNNWGYDNVLFVLQNLSPTDLISIHNTGDCFIIPSRGESLCRPLMDAAYIGNRIIATYNTGMCDIIQQVDGYQLQSKTIPAMASQPPLSYLYTGYEQWQQVDIANLQKHMRSVFDSWCLNKNKFTDSKKHMKKFSYTSIAQQLESIL